MTLSFLATSASFSPHVGVCFLKPVQCIRDASFLQGTIFLLLGHAAPLSQSLVPPVQSVDSGASRGAQITLNFVTMLLSLLFLPPLSCHVVPFPGNSVSPSIKRRVWYGLGVLPSLKRVEMNICTDKKTCKQRNADSLKPLVRNRHIGTQGHMETPTPQINRHRN